MKITRALRAHTLHVPSALHLHATWAYSNYYACAIDDRYLHARCAHEHHNHAYAIWAWSIGVATMANKNTLFVML